MVVRFGSNTTLIQPHAWLLWTFICYDGLQVDQFWQKTFCTLQTSDYLLTSTSMGVVGSYLHCLTTKVLLLLLTLISGKLIINWNFSLQSIQGGSLLHNVIFFRVEMWKFLSQVDNTLTLLLSASSLKHEYCNLGRAGIFSYVNNVKIRKVIGRVWLQGLRTAKKSQNY